MLGSTLLWLLNLVGSSGGLVSFSGSVSASPTLCTLFSLPPPVTHLSILAAEERRAPSFVPGMSLSVPLRVLTHTCPSKLELMLRAVDSKGSTHCACRLSGMCPRLCGARSLILAGSIKKKKKKRDVFVGSYPLSTNQNLSGIMKLITEPNGNNPCSH